MSKVVKIDDLKSLFFDGMSILVGGFLGCGTAEPIIDLLIDLDVKDLTIIANDTSFPDKGVGRLVANNQVKKVIASHVGTNPITGKLMNEGKLEVELSPQGTLIERIRAGGFGLGGILTPTGLGTSVEEGKQVVEVEGKKFLVETPIRADFALVYGTESDSYGNTFCAGTTKNFNMLIPFAADKVIVCSEDVVTRDNFDVEKTSIPGVVVDYVVKGEY